MCVCTSELVELILEEHYLAAIAGVLSTSVQGGWSMINAMMNLRYDINLSKFSQIKVW